MFSLILLGVFLAASAQSLAAGSINEEEMKELAQLSSQIKNQCNVSKCLFIGLGGSTTLLTELLSVQASTATMHLPLSSFKYTPQELKLSQINKLYSHFDKVFEVEGIKVSQYSQIILFDYAFSGRSLAASSYYLESYIKSKKLENKVSFKSIFIGTQEMEKSYLLESLKTEFLLNKAEFIRIDNLRQVSNSFFNEKYDAYRKYPGFELNKTSLLEIMTSQYVVSQSFESLHSYLQSYIPTSPCNQYLLLP